MDKEQKRIFVLCFKILTMGLSLSTGFIHTNFNKVVCGLTLKVSTRTTILILWKMPSKRRERISKSTNVNAFVVSNQHHPQKRKKRRVLLLEKLGSRRLHELLAHANVRLHFRGRIHGGLRAGFFSFARSRTNWLPLKYSK